MDNNFERYGDNFQQKSKYVRNELPRHALDWGNKPKTYKVYSDTFKKIKLPTPDFDQSIEFWSVIKNRHSTRKFSTEPLSIMDLSPLPALKTKKQLMKMRPGTVLKVITDYRPASESVPRDLAKTKHKHLGTDFLEDDEQWLMYFESVK